MTIRQVTRWAVRGGFLVALGAATTLPAQVDTTRRDTTRARTDTARVRTDTTTRATSTQRIRITKESRGEVMLTPRTTRPRLDSTAYNDSVARANQARSDSIMAADRARNDSIAAAERARTDSLSLTTRNDSVANAARADSLARIEQMRTDSMSRDEQMRRDSIARATPPVVSQQQSVSMSTPKMPKSFYMGLALGAASPMSDLKDLGYDGGLNVTVPIGWQNPSSMLGLRLTLAYSQFQGGPFTTGGASGVVLNNPDPKVYSAEANLNVRFPFNERRTSSVYLFGGGGLHMFRNFGESSALGAYLGNDVLDPNDSGNESTINKWGINGGAGLEFGIGTSSLFVESRWVNVYTGRDQDVNFDNLFGSRGTTVRWVPIVLGFTIR